MRLITPPFAARKPALTRWWYLRNFNLSGSESYQHFQPEAWTKENHHPPVHVDLAMHAITPRRWLAIVAMAGIALLAHNSALGDSAATATVGQTVTISVTVAAGTTPFDYQWRKDGVNLADGGNISGVTTSALVITNVQVSDTGNYTAVVSARPGTNFTGLALVELYETP